ncbi:MAG: tetratricopeptide repeat protein [Myxococcota bacterium]
MIYSILLLIAAQFFQSPRFQSGDEIFNDAAQKMLNGNKGAAITAFKTHSHRFSKHEKAAWSNWFMALLYEEKGDFLAANAIWQRLLAKYPDFIFYRMAKVRQKFLLSGINSGGPIIMRKWKKLFKVKKLDDQWEKRALEFLKRFPDFNWNLKLRLKLAGYYLNVGKAQKSAHQLKFIQQKLDREHRFYPLVKKSLIAIYLNENNHQELANLAETENDSQLKNLISQKELISKVHFWFLLAAIALLIFFLFPITAKRQIKFLYLALLGLVFSMIPGSFQFLAVIMIYLGVFLYLSRTNNQLRNKKIIQYPAWVFLGLFLPFHALMVTGNFPWLLLLK